MEQKSSLLKEWGGLLAGIAGVLTAAGALLKSADHSVTQSAYNTLSESIAKLSDQQQKDHEDMANIRGYLDGMARTPPASRFSAVGGSPPPASRFSAVGGSPSPSPSPGGGLTPLDRSTLYRPTADAVPVPTVSPAPKLIRAPDFSTIK
jgi:hypothetical protein